MNLTLNLTFSTNLWADVTTSRECRIGFPITDFPSATSGLVVSKTKKFKDFQKMCLPISKTFQKTFESNQMFINCDCKRHTYNIKIQYKDFSNIRISETTRHPAILHTFIVTLLNTTGFLRVVQEVFSCNNNGEQEMDYIWASEKEDFRTNRDKAA